MPAKQQKVLVRIKKIWRNHFPGEVVGLAVAPRDEAGNLYKQKNRDGSDSIHDAAELGDLVLESAKRFGTCVRVPPEEALGQFLNAAEMVDHGYTADEIAKAQAHVAKNSKRKAQLEEIESGAKDRAAVNKRLNDISHGLVPHPALVEQARTGAKT